MEAVADVYELSERELMDIDGGLDGEDVCMLIGSAIGSAVGGPVGTVTGGLVGAGFYHLTENTDPLDTHLASL